MLALKVLIISSVLFLVCIVVAALTLSLRILGVGAIIYVSSFAWCMVKFFGVNLGTFAQIKQSSDNLARKVKEEKGVGVPYILLSLMGPIMVTALVVLVIAIITLLFI